MKATEKHVSKAEISTYSYFIQQNSSTFVALAMSTTLAISLCLNLKVFSNPSASKYLQTHYKQIIEHYVGAYKNTVFLLWDVISYGGINRRLISIDYACMKIFRKFKIEKKLTERNQQAIHTHTLQQKFNNIKTQQSFTLVAL